MGVDVGVEVGVPVAVSVGVAVAVGSTLDVTVLVGVGSGSLGAPPRWTVTTAPAIIVSTESTPMTGHDADP